MFGIRSLIPLHLFADLPIETLCIFFTVLAIITTVLYFQLSSYNKALERKNRTFVKTDLTGFEEQKVTQNDNNVNEEKLVERQQLEQIYKLMSQNNELSSSLEELQDQLKLYR